MGPGFVLVVERRRDERVGDAHRSPAGSRPRDAPSPVFVAQDGRAVKRAVKAPLRNGAEALVEDGLTPGARVVVYPSDALRDGSRIVAR